MQKEKLIAYLEESGFTAKVNPNTNDTFYAKPEILELRDFTYNDKGKPESGIKWQKEGSSDKESCYVKVTIARTKKDTTARLHKSSYDEMPLEIGNSYAGQVELRILDADGELYPDFKSRSYNTIFNREDVTTEDALGLSFESLEA